MRSPACCNPHHHWLHALVGPGTPNLTIHQAGSVKLFLILRLQDYTLAADGTTGRLQIFPR